MCGRNGITRFSLSAKPWWSPCVVLLFSMSFWKSRCAVEAGRGKSGGAAGSAQHEGGSWKVRSLKEVPERGPYIGRKRTHRRKTGTRQDGAGAQSKTQSHRHMLAGPQTPPPPTLRLSDAPGFLPFSAPPTQGPTPKGARAAPSQDGPFIQSSP